MTLDTEGHIVDFVLLIGPSSAAAGPDGQDENHRAKLNSITTERATKPIFRVAELKVRSIL